MAFGNRAHYYRQAGVFLAQISGDSGPGFPSRHKRLLVHGKAARILACFPVRPALRRPWNSGLTAEKGTISTRRPKTPASARSPRRRR